LSLGPAWRWKAQINDAIRTALSPRFLPDEIFAAPEIPRTLSGKKQEVPIKKLFLGHAADKVMNREAMANPECIGWYQDQADQYQTRSAERD
jgi:acetoacetyl-CoA synthetase